MGVPRTATVTAMTSCVVASCDARRRSTSSSAPLFADGTRALRSGSAGRLDERRRTGRRPTARPCHSPTRRTSAVGQSPAHANTRHRSTQRNVPCRRSGRTCAASVRCPSSVEASCLAARRRAPVERVEAPEVGQDAGEARELDATSSRRASPARPAVGASSSRPRASTSSSEPCMPAPGSPCGSSAIPSGSAHRLVHVVRERHLGLRGEVLAEHPEALVRVDAPAARRRDRRLALEGEARTRAPGGAGPSSPAGRPARRGRRCPPPRRRAPRARRRASRPRRGAPPCRVAVRRDDCRPACARLPPRTHGPAVDLAEGPHAARY